MGDMWTMVAAEDDNDEDLRWWRRREHETPTDRPQEPRMRG